MITRINLKFARIALLATFLLAVFAGSQLLQPTVAGAIDVPTYPFKLTKSISDNYTPDPYTADEFKFTVSGYGIVDLTEYTDDTAEAIIYLPAGTHTVEEVGPDGFIPEDWTLQWSGPGCETEDDGNGPVRPIEITVVETSVDYPLPDDVGNACKADNQWRGEPAPILGCMNPDADNYNPAATEDDGSCDFGEEVVLGCTDPDALNYNPDATPGNLDAENCEYDNGDQCVLEADGSWADAVASSDQGDTKADGAITNPDRIDPAKTLGAEDWVANGSTGFFSLGFGGSIVLSFDSYVPNVAGTDLTVYEATNGDTYPAETATVEVSQNGSTWVLAGTANNTTIPDRTTAIDFDGTGLDWISYVRITDTTNPALHSNDADGFDLDAVEATQQVCDEPNDNGGGDNDGPKWLVYGYVWHDKNESDIWEVEQPNPDDNETDLDGWTVRITNGEDTYSTTTDVTGYYYFYVPAGTWTINEEVQSQWSQTFPNVNGHIVEVTGGITQAENTNFFAMVMDYFVPTAHAAVLPTTYGPYNFGNVREGSGCTSNCGGGYSQGSYGGGGHSSSGSRSKKSSNDDEPEGEVLGEAISVMPVGAPNTGAGGTTPFAVQLPTLTAILSLSTSVRKVKNG